MLNPQKNLERYIRHRIVCEMKLSLLHSLITKKIFSQVVDELVYHYSSIIKFDNYFVASLRKPIYNIEDYTTSIIAGINQRTVSSLILNVWDWSESIHSESYWRYVYTLCYKKD